MPFKIIQEWLAQEENAGSENPNRAVLATANSKAIPHSRIVAIREIEQGSILFFTQKGTRKVMELTDNPYASMTIWLAQQQREVILDGCVQALSLEENEHYWKTMPHDRQLRFTTYAPTSGKPLSSETYLDDLLKELTVCYENSPIPMSPDYCGFRLIPEAIYFYTLGSESFSDVQKYTKNNGAWQVEQMSP